MHHQDIHSRPTRIVRAPRKVLDEQRTLECGTVARAAVCGGCATELAHGTRFCGMCGGRVGACASLCGTFVDDYQVVDTLHESAASTVYRARYLPSGELVALKVLHPDLARDALQVARFRREARCLARLRSAHTVKVYDHGETEDGIHYLAMELVEGEGLDVRMRKGAMPWRSALAIQRAVCVSLVEAHAHGIVYRGLRPSHVRLGQGDSVKLIDFGLAKLRPEDPEDDPSYPDHAMGMPLRYLAPELCAGAAADRGNDLYALGVLTLELILGRERIIGGPPAVLPAEVPSKVERLLLRCFAGDPSERFASASEVVREIDLICDTSRDRRRVFAHTPVFELEPPRVVIDTVSVPAFVRGEMLGSEIEIAAPRPSRRWARRALAVLVSAIGLGTVAMGTRA